MKKRCEAEAPHPLDRFEKPPEAYSRPGGDAYLEGSPTKVL